MRTAKVLGALALALAGTLASPTFADVKHGWRLGMGITSEKLEGDFSVPGFTTSGDDTVQTNEERFGYQAMLGYTFAKWVAVEASFNGGTQFNQFIPEFAAEVSVAPVQPAPPPAAQIPDTPPFFIVRNNFKTFEASGVFSWWITNKFSLFGRGGFIAWRDETYFAFGDVDTLAPNPYKFYGSTNDSGFAPLVGLGAQTTLDGALVRIEYKYSDVGDLNFGPANSYSQTDNTVSSLQFSIVWQLR